VSKMYGKLRVVLENNPARWDQLVCICGSDSPSAIHPGKGSGNYHPLGYWYKEGDLFYVDLKSADQWYSSVNKETIAHKRLGGLPTKQALREYVMQYWLNRGAL